MFYNGYRSAKSINEFMGLEAKDTLKQFHTCNNCHNRPYINMKKRQNKNEKSQENDLNIIEPDNFYDYIIEIFQLYSIQLENDIENICNSFFFNVI